ncbi:hypothetical protein SAMN04487947_4021 [Halogeometricum rufum]|uniref:DUF7982 domain-containing protein n=1 Tax=Halogeometricum rufum TaxID=553469 RepID=A0A1I6J493_9EURY|nr:hypothetical protein [Halogeometricum rufum]SFR73759.1 hypothetical protein SAMN04487947_4021 [Halogeometricum rufum]
MSFTDDQTTESFADGRTDSDVTESAPSDRTDVDDTQRRIEELRAENRRLREDYARGKQLQHRQTALGLMGVGLVGIAAGIAFPDARTVLLALGATGVFGAILTYFLSPERVMPATVGQSAYDAVGETGASVRDELGLADATVYAPVTASTSETRAPVRLFVPQTPDYELPSDEELRSTFVVPDDGRRRGVAFTPTAGRMLAEFERAASGGVSADPESLGNQLCDALVEQFELARAAEAEFDEERRRLSVGVTGVAYGDATGFDHPVTSFLGGGLAHGLDEAVTVERERVEDGEAEFVVSCRW